MTSKNQAKKLNELRRKVLRPAKFLVNQLKLGNRAVLGLSQRVNRLISKIENEIMKLENQ